MEETKRTHDFNGALLLGAAVEECLHARVNHLDVVADVHLSGVSRLGH